MRVAHNRGFTLVELLIAVAVIGVIAAIALPGLLRAKAAGNEASAAASLRAINSSQASYAITCGRGAYAATLAVLGTPANPGEVPFIGFDLGLAATTTKSGYIVTMAGTPVGAGSAASCNGGILVAGYYSTASPVAPGLSGTHYLWTNVSSAIYRQTIPFTSTNEHHAPASDPAALVLQ